MLGRVLRQFRQVDVFTTAPFLGNPVAVVLDAEGFTVACADGRIRVLRVRPAGGDKVGAAAFAASAKLVLGSRLT